MSWAASQTRPDVSFDAYDLSTKLNKATYRDAKYSKKVVMKAKEEDVKLKFGHLGHIQNLHIELFVDAALGNMEKKFHTKSMMGYFIALANDDLKISPLHWKSKVIEKVAEDVKTAETLALETAVDDAIHLTNIITELCFGNDNKYQIPIVVNEDSKSLVESLYSTKKVKRKTMRVVISLLQQHMKNKTIQHIHHVKSEDQLGDIFTKRGVSKEQLLRSIETGSLILTERKKKVG